ncbi:MAG: hypothetical protein GY866_31185, partial [Proteobacteria bacterium]|nr:hypothetical protein [Pseudomonadota bacterium]
ARAASLKAGLGFKAYGIKGSGTIGHSGNDATGKYQDSTTTNLSLGASYPLGDFIPGIKASFKEKTMKEIDPRKTNVNQKDKASTFQMKVSYKMWPKVVLGADVKSKKQTSNVAASEHEVGSASVTMTVIF